MQFSPLLIEKYITYMERKHALVISHEQAQTDLMQLAKAQDAFMQGRAVEPARPTADRREA